MASGEFNLVVHQIIMDFRTNKDGPCQIKLHSAPEVTHEMVAADEIGKAGKLVALQERCVETNALYSDSRLQVQLRPLVQRWTIDSPKIVKKWPERLDTLVQVLAGPPGRVKACAQIVIEEEVHTEVEIGPAANRGYLGIGGRRGQPGSSKTHIKLLCLRRASQQKKEAKRRNVQR